MYKDKYLAPTFCEEWNTYEFGELMSTFFLYTMSESVGPPSSFVFHVWCIRTNIKILDLRFCKSPILMNLGNLCQRLFLHKMSESVSPPCSFVFFQ